MLSLVYILILNHIIREAAAGVSLGVVLFWTTFECELCHDVL